MSNKLSKILLMSSIGLFFVSIGMPANAVQRESDDFSNTIDFGDEDDIGPNMGDKYDSGPNIQVDPYLGEEQEDFEDRREPLGEDY